MKTTKNKQIRYLISLIISIVVCESFFLFNNRFMQNDAEVAAKLEIAQKQNELAIKQAELKKEADIKMAEADAAYSIQQEEQRKTIEITTANANLAKQEKEIELKEREVSIKERELEAKIKKTAEAEKYAVQQNADAALYEKQKFSDADLYERQRKAEAEKFEALQEAEAVKAESEAKRVAMENEAKGIQAKGEAEAAAIQAKALAEAEGILKKAEAMKQYGEAAMADMQLEVSKAFIAQLPAIMAAAGQAYTNVDSIYMYGGESSKLTEDIMKNVTQVSEGLSQTLGIDLKQVANAFIGSTMANKIEV
jgi:flotillin